MMGLLWFVALTYFLTRFLLMYGKIRGTIGSWLTVPSDDAFMFHFEKKCRIFIGVEWIVLFGAENGSKGLYLLVLEHF